LPTDDTDQLEHPFRPPEHEPPLDPTDPQSTERFTVAELQSALTTDNLTTAGDEVGVLGREEAFRWCVGWGQGRVGAGAGEEIVDGRESEVGEGGLAVAVQEDVLGFDVAVVDAGFVGHGEGSGDGHADVGDFLDAEDAVGAESVEEAAAGHVGHDDDGPAVAGERGLVDGDDPALVA